MCIPKMKQKNLWYFFVDKIKVPNLEYCYYRVLCSQIERNFRSRIDQFYNKHKDVFIAAMWIQSYVGIGYLFRSIALLVNIFSTLQSEALQG